MRLIVGLGNPGSQYAGTRHNVGFLVANHLADRWAIHIRQTACRAKVGEGIVHGHSVGLALPQTRMNSSGEAVQCLLKRWRVEPSNLLVVCDDVSLPLGMIRCRPKGSDGGHHGLASVLEHLHTDQVARLRVGIKTNPMGEDLTAFVLGRFRSGEKKLLAESLEACVKACEVWVLRGLSAAMNLFNKKAREVERVKMGS